MDRALELEIVDQLLDVLERPTVELTDSVYEEPVEAYASTERFALECSRIFGQTPLMAAISSELPAPGSWKLFEDAGVPVVLVRGDDGVVRGFLNVCGHRGARLVEAPRGAARRLSCPFHAWSYNMDGSLGGIPAQQAFAGVCREDRALTPVQTREHLGMIWVVTDPDAAEMNLDVHLGPFAAELARWDLSGWHHVETRKHDVAANWKITMDTFTEAYHISALHKDSLGPLGASSVNLYHAIGDHHRQVFPMKNLTEIRELPREQWQAFDEWRFAFTYIIYPNVSLFIAGDHADLYQTFPGESPGTSVCLQSLFAFEPVQTEEKREQYREMMDFFFNLVENEDFRMSAGIERGLRTGANTTHVFGRNEPMTQAMHKAYQRDLRAAATKSECAGKFA